MHNQIDCTEHVCRKALRFTQTFQTTVLVVQYTCQVEIWDHPTSRQELWQRQVHKVTPLHAAKLVGPVSEPLGKSTAHILINGTLTASMPAVQNYLSEISKYQHEVPDVLVISDTSPSFSSPTHYQTQLFSAHPRGSFVVWKAAKTQVHFSKWALLKQRGRKREREQDGHCVN